jgi:hypothetical protein
MKDWITQYNDMVNPNRKIRKLAVIRNNIDDVCPFGLRIPFACKAAGEVIKKMAPVDLLGEDASDDDIEQLVKANMELLVLEAAGKKCFYASDIIEKTSAVNCSFGTGFAGMSSQGLEPSRFYSKIYENIAYDGLYSVPMGYYADSNISQNTYYGSYSLQGSKDDSEIEKSAGELSNNKE